MRPTADTPSPFYGLRLPDWGPYGKYYAGASRILHDPSHGMFDLIPVIGYVRGKLIIPDVSYDCGYCHWDATDDLSYFSYRYELAWKDVEYVDVEFLAAGGASLLAKLTFVNNTPLDREYVCTLFAVHRVRPYVELTLAPGETWLGAEGYAHLSPAPGGPAPASVRVDGMRQGIVVEPCLVGGMGVGNAPWRDDSQFTAKDHTADNRAFILGPGAELTWRLPEIEARPRRRVSLRYALFGCAGGQATLHVDGAAYPLALEGCAETRTLGFEDLRWATATLGASAAPREITLRIDALAPRGDAPALVIDGLLLGDEDEEQKLATRLRYHADVPRFLTMRDPGRPGVVFASAVRPGAALALYSQDERPVPPAPYSDATVTHVYHGDLSGDVQRKLCNDSLVNWDAFNCVVQGDGSNHFAGYNLAPIVCRAQGRREAYVALVYGGPGDVSAQAARLYAERTSIEATARARLDEHERSLPHTPHRLSQQLLHANLAMNVVYPNRIENDWYIAHTPAKRWSSMCQWDSGMHALGHAEYAPERALEVFRQYTSEAILSAWGLFPIHILAFWELWQRQPERAWLEELYPRFRRFYEYLLGRAPGSQAVPSECGLLIQGGGAYGIDDYPARVQVSDHDHSASVASADTSAYAIRAAKTMRLMAQALGVDDDQVYRDDIARLARALQTYAWNERSGYYSYVDVRTLKPLLYRGACDYNMGLDGVSPYVAGICTAEQQRRLLGHLTSEGELWTPYGLTAVAQNAPYYRSLGYWVGKVWVPYQWVFWKALLGEGQLEHAERVASTALELWRRETEASYNSWELFDARTGMGQGAHQFAGLSGPIAALYHAHYHPGRLSVGYDTRVHTQRFVPETAALSAELSAPFRPGVSGILAALGKEGDFEVHWGDQCWRQPSAQGWLYLRLQVAETPLTLSVAPC